MKDGNGFQCQLAEGHGGHHVHASDAKTRWSWPNGDEAAERLRIADEQIKKLDGMLAEAERAGAALGIELAKERDLRIFAERNWDETMKARAAQVDLRIVAESTLAGVLEERDSLSRDRDHLHGEIDALKKALGDTQTVRDKAVVNVVELLERIDKLEAETAAPGDALTSPLFDLDGVCDQTLRGKVIRACEHLKVYKRYRDLAEESVASTGEASQTSLRPTSPVSDSGTSSLASAGGRMLSAWPASTTTPTSGPARARASRSRRRGRGSEYSTLDIFGRHGSSSSASADLQRSLESRLRVALASRGSTMFDLTWRDAVMPSGRRICVLRGLARRMRDSGSTSWPTPTVSRGDYGYDEAGQTKLKLAGVAQLSGWPTPLVNDTTGSTHTYAGGDHLKIALKLPGAAKLASWATPVATEISNTMESYVRMKRRTGRTAITHPSIQAQLADSGRHATGSGAETVSGGRLNPEHSRWLQGYPAEWEDSAVTATQSYRRSRPSSSEPPSGDE